MLSLPLPVRVYLCLEPTDMRRGFDGLSRMVRDHVGADPLSGDLFVFRSKRGDRVNRGLAGHALLGPAQRRTLRIEVHQDRLLLARGEIGCQVDCDGRLAGTPLGIHDDDALHGDLVCQVLT